MHEGGLAHGLLDLPMIAALILAAAMPACVPSGTNYLPTPSPCQVTIMDPVTHEPDVLVLRFLVTEPKPLKPGKWPLQDFHADQRKRKGWVKWLVLAVLL